MDSFFFTRSNVKITNYNSADLANLQQVVARYKCRHDRRIVCSLLKKMKVSGVMLLFLGFSVGLGLRIRV